MISQADVSKHTLVFQRHPKVECAKGIEIHHVAHLWSVLLCQWDIQTYHALYDMTFYTKHAHSCRCGAKISMGAFDTYVKKYAGHDNDQFLADYQAWLTSGPNNPPIHQGKSNNLYACGLTIWMLVHAYSGRNLRGQAYEDAADTLFSYCVNERVLARKKPMDSGLDVELRQLPIDMVCYKVFSRRQQALKSLNHPQSSDADVAKILVIHSMAYLWTYDSEPLAMMWPSHHGKTGELAERAISYHKLQQTMNVLPLPASVDAEEACLVLWKNDKYVYAPILPLASNSYLEQWPKHMMLSSLIHRDIFKVVTNTFCGCQNQCQDRIHAHMLISSIVIDMARGARYNMDIELLHTTWKRLTLESNGCYRDLSAILMSASSPLWLM